MTEATLTKSMIKLIKGRGGWARKSHGGIHGAGWPDIVSIYRGYPIMLEVKLPGKEKRLTKLQAAVLAQIKDAGGVALVVTRRSQVGCVLDHIDSLKDE